MTYLFTITRTAIRNRVIELHASDRASVKVRLASVARPCL